MTRRQALWILGIAVAVTAVLVALHLAMPIGQTWAVNRILHHVWEAATGLAGAGSLVWLMWPRPKVGRRDEQRLKAHRRVIALVAIVLAVVLLIVFAEIRRDLATRTRLGGPAVADLQAIGKALDAYAADHGGAEPPSIADLAPKYLEASRLYYAHRHGPGVAGPLADAGGPDAEAPSYTLAKRPVPRDTKPRPASALRAYLRPGNAWAPLTAVLDKGGTARVSYEDEVREFEEEPGTGR
jgi:hypothetical protein